MSNMTQKTEIAVIGAGHAGIEAALAAARMGNDTVLFTMSFESIANMPCNPSIGGTGKAEKWDVLQIRLRFSQEL